MIEANHFFDTYAIIETLEGNQAYQAYAEASAVITIFNLAEIYWVVLNRLSEAEANEVYGRYEDSVVEIDADTLKEAIVFRKKHKKKRLSYSDCIGYVYATRHHMQFLTGDKQFEHLPNVMFVK